MMTNAAPASVPGCIGRGFKFAHSAFAVFGLIFLVNLLGGATEILFPAARTAGTPLAVWIGIWNVALAIISFLAWVGLLGSMKAALTGQSATLGTLFSAIPRYVWRVLGAALVTILVVALGVLLAVLLPMLFGDTATQTQMLLAGIWLAVILGFTIYLGLLLAFAPYLIVAEERKIFTALRTSITFVRSQLAKVVGLVLLTLLVGLVAVAIVLGIIFLGVALNLPDTALDWLGTVVGSFATTYLTFVTGAAWMALLLGLRGSASAGFKPGPVELTPPR